MIHKLILTFLYISFLGFATFSQDSTNAENVEIDSVKIYQVEKLKQEIEQLKSQNTLKPIFRIIPTYAGIVAALVAILGAILSYLKYLKEKHNEIEQRLRESKIQLETKFNSIVNDLGSESHSIKASATVSLMTFLKPEYKEFHQQVYLILLANLKTKLPKNVNSLMIKAFEKAIRLNLEFRESQKLKNKEYQESIIELDLSRANLYRIDLHGLNLENVDLAFSDLRYANLDNCNLKRAKGYETNFTGARLSRSNMQEGRFNQAIFENAQFHSTNLVSTKLKGTNLKGAEFQQAQLQEANLDGADIHGAKFQYANLNNTFFRKLTYSDSDLRNILKSKNASWKKANFDKEIYQKLEQF